MRKSYQGSGMYSRQYQQNSEGYQSDSSQTMYSTMTQYATIRQKRSLFGRLYDWIFQVEESVVSASPQPPYRRVASGASARVLQEEPRPAAWRTGEGREEYLLMQKGLVEKALRDWKAATVYYENVSDPALVDFAAYEMEAARRKYIYLLNSAKGIYNQ